MCIACPSEDVCSAARLIRPSVSQGHVEGLGSEVRPGLVVHLAVEQAEGGLRYIDVWESEADCAAFVEERLHPVVHTLLREVFGDDLPPEPDRTPLGVVHVWGRGAD